MSIQTIYAQLVQAGLSPVGACAIMGNMRKESCMVSTNVQDRCGYSDDNYTAGVDAGLIDFVADRIGYGLCQWTEGSRKYKLLNFVRQRGVSIGDEAAQVAFCIFELQTDFPSLWSYLCTCKGIYQAAAKVCTEYERPKEDTSAERARYADEFYCSLSSMDISAVIPEPETVPGVQKSEYWPPRCLEYGFFGADVLALQALLVAHGYVIGVDGEFGNETRTAVIAFQTANSLTADGAAAEATWKELFSFD